MGACHFSSLKVKISFIFDPRFFPVAKRAQKVPLNYTIKSLCKELTKIMKAGFSRNEYSICLKLRNQMYTSKDISLISELYIKNAEKIFVHVVPRNKNSRMVNIKIHCCTDTDLCVSVASQSTISQLEDSISDIKHCCANIKCKILCNDLELRSDEECAFPSDKTLHAVFQGQHLGCAPKPWKIKKSGLIQEGICLNLNCVAYKQSICINKGLGKFSLSNQVEFETYQCTMCGDNLYNTKRFGFINC